MVPFYIDYEDSINPRRQRYAPEPKRMELTYEERERQDRQARRLGVIPEYRRIAFVHFEDEFQDKYKEPNYCIKCSTISRVATGGTTVVPDGRRGLTPYFGGSITEDKQSMNFVPGKDSGDEDKWVCPRCGYELFK